MTQQMDVRFIPVSAGDDETVRKLSAFAGKIVHEHLTRLSALSRIPI